jgi:hypothetical protein
MAFIWSFGIKFKSIEEAEKAKSKIDTIILSDGTEVGIHKGITYQNGNLSLKECTLDLWLHHMQVAGDQKLLSFPYYYEIRDFYYQFLRDLEIDFNMALFEFEGADRIAHNNLIENINEDGIGAILNSDNCANLQVSDTIYQSKRILDGLVVSEENLGNLKKEFSGLFVPFKPGYYWLPL